MSNPHAVQLETAKRVVHSVMKTRGARDLFNAPVDPEAFKLADYFEVIKQPIDLGTIHKRLVDGFKNAWDERSYYKTTEAVFDDVSRVWRNCYLYNKGPNDATIRDVCKKTQRQFEMKWREAGLMKTEGGESTEMLSNEAQVPEMFSARNDSAEMPVRLLDQFSISCTEKAEMYIALEEVTAENIHHIHATGKVVPHAEQPSSHSSPVLSSFSVHIGSLVDWCFQYGNLPGIWLITHHAWYKLLRPSDSYAPYLSGTLHKFMTSMYIINFRGGTDASSALSQSAEAVFENGMDEDGHSLPDDIVEMLMEDETVKGEALKPIGKRSRSPSKSTAEENGIPNMSDSDTSIVDEAANGHPSEENTKSVTTQTQRSLRSSKTTAHSAQQSLSKTKASQQRTSKIGTREKSASRKKPRTHSPTPVGNDIATSFSEMDEDDPLFDPGYDNVLKVKRFSVPRWLPGCVPKDDEDEDYVNETGKKQRSKRIGESEAQRLKREKKATEQLKREQEADRRRGQPPAVVSDFRLPQEHVGLALSCWDFFLTFHIKLEIPPFPFWRFEAAICPLYAGMKRSDIKHQMTKESRRAVQDTESKASALLLQDVHLSLWRVLQGKSQFNKDAPSHATLETKQPSGSHWTQTVSLFLLKSSVEDVDDDARSIAAFLHGHEYLDLTVASKLKIFYTLINMVVSTEVFRDHLNTLVDKLSFQKMHPYEERPLNAAVLESMSLSFERKSANLSAEKWTDWFLAHRIGVLSSIGHDFRGTHYWVLGSVSGCYRLYVERRSTQEQYLKSGAKNLRPRGRSKSSNDVCWGWYEGEAVAQFIDWLKDGDLESEKHLLDALGHVPKPIQLERQRSHSDSSTLNIISLGYHKMDKATLDIYRMDAYSDTRFPLLRGEGEIVEPPNEVHPTTRINACVRALLATIPFWEKEPAVVAKICSAADRVMSPLETAHLSKEICNVMDLVFEHGAIREEWKTLRKQWETSMHDCPSLHGIMAHLSVFQSFVLPPSHSVHRPAFNVMIQESKCPLYFPMPGENVVVLKTGCLAHLERYLKFSRQTLAAPSAAACFQQSKHPEFIALARTNAERLTPVEHFRVCSISYRSPYRDAPPEGSLLADDGSLPIQPCMWLLLTSSNDLSSGAASIALPLHVDNTLPDFIVKVSAFEQSRRTNWKTGDRFKMFFGGKSLTRGPSGEYYKGTISSVKQSVSGEAYDPWESLTVEWDNDHTGASMTVSPWEIEVDPEEQRKLEEARMRQMESRARQARVLAKHHRTEYLAEMMDNDEAQSIGDPDYDPLADSEGGKSVGRSRRRGSALQELVYYDPKNPSGPVPAEMISIIPGVYEFPILIHNFMQRLKGKFKCPVFSGKDLDLYKVFHEVQKRGGYEVVTNVKLWKDVCRTLNVDLTGQTSASYNMRLNYEKCLLDFEHYLSSGRYRQELDEGTAPSCTVFEPFPQKLRGLELDPAVTKGISPNPSASEQMVTRGARRSRNVSMTQLLMGENSNTDWNQITNPRSASGSHTKSESERVISPPVSRQPDGDRMELSEQKNHMSVPLVAQGDRREFEGIRKIQAGSKSHIEIQPGESIGMALDRMGWALVGSHVWRRCPGQGTWRKAEVTDFNREANEHCLVLDKSSEMEQTEWVDLRELEGEELSQYDPTPALPTVERRSQKTALKTPPQDKTELSHLLAPPRALQRYGTETSTQGVTSLSAAAKSGMDPMEWFHQVLRSGMNPELLKHIVDDAALHRICEEASRDHLASQSDLIHTPVVGQLAPLLTKGITQSGTRHLEKAADEKRSVAPATDSHLSKPEPGKRAPGESGMGTT